MSNFRGALQILSLLFILLKNASTSFVWLFSMNSIQFYSNVLVCTLMPPFFLPVFECCPIPFNIRLEKCVIVVE